MRARIALALALTASLAVGCSDDDGATPEASPPATSPTTDREPEPEPPADVRGERTDLVVADLSVENTGLFRDGSERDSGPPADERAIGTAVTASTDWLDAHLTDLQDGGPGLVADVGLDGDPAQLSTGLTDPSRPAEAVSYAVTVGARGAPEWVRVSVAVVRADGEATATFVFVPDGDDVRLVAAEPAAGTTLPAPRPEEGS